MSKLTALRKQIAALEAQAERIAKAEMSSAIAKVKDIMAEFNLTIEHLTQAVGSKRAATKTKAKLKAKAKSASVAKYVDPKSGKTWSGVGRAPAWIAGAKNRDAFLVAGSTAAETAKAAAPARKAASKAARKVAKPATKKAGKVVNKRAGSKAAPVATKKRPAAKKAVARKAAPKAIASKRAAQAPADSGAAPAA